MKSWVKFFGALNWLLMKSFTILVVESSDERFGPELPYNPLGIFYLTTQVNWLLFFYFILGFIGYIFEIQSINNFIKKASGLLFVCGTYICFGYYGFVHFSDVIQDLVKRVENFALFMHWIHFIPFVFILVDLYYHSVEGNVLYVYSTFPQVFVYYIFYILLGILCFKINNLWPYPFQNEMNVMQMTLFNIFISFFLLFITWMGSEFSKFCFKNFANKPHLN